MYENELRAGSQIMRREDWENAKNEMNKAELEGRLDAYDEETDAGINRMKETEVVSSSCLLHRCGSLYICPTAAQLSTGRVDKEPGGDCGRNQTCER